MPDETSVSCSDDELSFVMTGSRGIECFPSVWSLAASSRFGSGGGTPSPPIAAYHVVSDIDTYPISMCLPRSECYEFSLADFSGGIPRRDRCDGEFFNEEGNFAYGDPPVFVTSIGGSKIEDGTSHSTMKFVATDYISASLSFGDCFESMEPLDEYERVLSDVNNSTADPTPEKPKPICLIIPALLLFLALVVFILHYHPKNREIRAKFVKAHLRTQKLEAKDVISRQGAHTEGGTDPTSRHLDGTSSTVAAETRRRRRRSEAAAAAFVRFVKLPRLRLSVLTKDEDDDAAACPAQPAECMRSDNVCAICLGEYAEGDVIGRSANPDCVHVFHEECITEWLMKKDDCPNCRLKYLDASGNG